MKKLTALAGVLLLSTSLLTACGPDNAADRGASPDNRNERYDTTRGGRVMDTRDNKTNYTDTRTGREANYKYGVRGYQPGAPNVRGNGFGFGAPDRDRLGVRDDIGPDNRIGVNRGGGFGAPDRDRLGVRDDIGPDRGGLLGGLGAGAGAGIFGLANGGFGFGAPDQDRLGVRDNIGPDRGTMNARADRTLESRVEALPGVRNATVVVAGNTAYVAVDRGMDATRNNTYANGANTPGDLNRGSRNNMLGFGGRDYGLTDDLRTRVTDAVRSASPTITNVYVSANPAVMNRLDSYVRNATGTGTTAGNTAGMGTGTTTR